MKILLILGVLSLTSCALKEFPASPNIKKQYLVEVRDEEASADILNIIENPSEIPKIQEVARCLSFDIITWHPYKIKFVGQVAMKECHLVGGYKHTEIQGILNWVDDVYIWAQDRKHCFKN